MRIKRISIGVTLCLCLLMTVVTTPAFAQWELDAAPINYETTAPQDAVAKIQERISAGELRLERDAHYGFLQPMLKELNIPVSSQVLVFSKTSVQTMKISPRTPRAIYFNDDSYVAWVPRGELLEIMSTDPQQGQQFYTIRQAEDAPAGILRDRGNCLSCHAGSRTQGVPGVLARSVVSNKVGRPDFSAGTFNTDHRSPFRDRWGGWYVSGTHGDVRHMGNVTTLTQTESDALDVEAGANVTDLSDKFPVSQYLSPHSDLVALMVLNHQAQMHNFLTLANYDCRSALYSDGILNEAMQRPADYRSETTQRRIASAGDRVLRYMLFCEEYALTHPVAGTSTFTAEFSQRGPRDKQGRSLRDFDLQTRLFKYPCSYLIYSAAFHQLPAPMKSYVVQRLDRILSEEDQDPAFAHLSPVDRQAIREILRDTLPTLWASEVSAAEAPAQ